ncbi:hypothetical protein F4859DRAFT_468635 [Xylaria cf. heliscus]|nr:hypothetical protein F4859DRAFT_468635 [Xylaria cf. heliscus]
MHYARGPLWTLQLAAGFAVASTSAASIRSNWVFERDDTCAANYTKCPQAGLPANFCCATGSTCSLLAGGTTVLCCPEGSDCGTIQPISCTISLQDPATNPKAQVKTTELDGKLPTCAKGCCPFGYHCDSDNANCVMDEDQSKKPDQTSTVPAATSPTSSVPSATSQTSSAPSTTSNGAASTSTTATAIEGSGQTLVPPTPTHTPSSAAAKTLNIAAIVGGVIGGLLALSLLTAGIWLLRRKRRQAGAEDEKERDSTMSFGNIGSISAPMPHADYHNQRLDFLAKAQGSSSHGNSASSTPTTQTIPNRFFPPNSPYSASVFGFGASTGLPVSGAMTAADADRPRSHHLSAEIGGLRSLTNRHSNGSLAAAAREDPFMPRTPRTPRGGRLNSGGSESINIFADPSTVGTPSDYNRRDTTWTDFQHHADQRSFDSPPLPRR